MENSQKVQAFRVLLDNACAEISDAARIAPEIFSGDQLERIRRELVRVIEIMDARVLIHVQGGAGDSW